MNFSSVLPDLMIGDMRVNPPIIQGGMGVRVSGPRLAAAVSNEGALGVLAAVGAGEEMSDRSLTYLERSYQGLREMIRQTRTMTSNPIGVNIMCALNNYADLVRAADEEEIGAILSGAGLPLQLPSLVKNPRVKLIPIVSSGRAAELICRAWTRRYRRRPDALVVEGGLAGGHLGVSVEDIALPEHSLDNILIEVLAVAERYPDAEGRPIPVVPAGGIFDGADIARVMRLGAKGVQMGTRFVCTDECDAHDAYKQAYVNCREEDILIIKSPLKMPLRVIRNAFVDRLLTGGRVRFRCPYHCLATCEPETSPYCIAQALVNAYRGNMEMGFATCGANAWRIDKVVTVRELIGELVTECARALAQPAPTPAG